MPKRSALDIAKSVVPGHVRASGKVVVQPKAPVKARAKARPMIAMAARGAVTAAPAAADVDIADRIAARLGVKQKAASKGTSADVEFTEHTPLGKRSIVVQVRNGKVKQILKRA